MKLIWKTAFAAYRLSLQTGSDDGYYPGPDYKFAHGSKRERQAINRALDIIKSPEDKMKHRAPGRILVKQRNRKNERANRWGPPTLFQYNCRCAVVKLDEMVASALSFGRADDGQRAFQGLTDPIAMSVGDDSFVIEPKHSMMSDKQREEYEAAMAEHRENHSRLLAENQASKRYAWITKGDKSTNRPIHKPGGDDETPKVEE